MGKVSQNVPLASERSSEEDKITILIRTVATSVQDERAR